MTQRNVKRFTFLLPALLTSCCLVDTPKPSTGDTSTPVNTVSATVSVGQELVSTQADTVPANWNVSTAAGTVTVSSGRVSGIEGKIGFLTDGDRSVGYGFVQNGVLKFDALETAAAMILIDPTFTGLSDSDRVIWLDRIKQTTSIKKLQQLVATSAQQGTDVTSLAQHPEYIAPMTLVINELKTKYPPNALGAQSIRAQAETAETVDGDIKLTTGKDEWKVDNEYAIYYIMSADGVNQSGYNNNNVTEGSIIVRPKQGLVNFKVDLDNLNWWTTKRFPVQAELSKVTTVSKGQVAQMMAGRTDAQLRFRTANTGEVIQQLWSGTAPDGQTLLVGALNTAETMKLWLGEAIAVKENFTDADLGKLSGALQTAVGASKTANSQLKNINEVLEAADTAAEFLDVVVNDEYLLAKLAPEENINTISASISEVRTWIQSVSAITGAFPKGGKRDEAMRFRDDLVKIFTTDDKRSQSEKAKEAWAAIKQRQDNVVRFAALLKGSMISRGLAPEEYELKTEKDAKDQLKAVVSLLNDAQESGGAKDFITSVAKTVLAEKFESALQSRLNNQLIWMYSATPTGKVLQGISTANKILPNLYDNISAPRDLYLYIVDGKVSPLPEPKLSQFTVTNRSTGKTYNLDTSFPERIPYETGECFDIKVKADLQRALTAALDYIPASYSWSVWPPTVTPDRPSVRAAGLRMSTKTASGSEAKFNDIWIERSGENNGILLNVPVYKQYVDNVKVTYPYDFKVIEDGGQYHLSFDSAKNLSIDMDNSGRDSMVCPKENGQKVLISYSNVVSTKTATLLFSKPVPPVVMSISHGWESVQEGVSRITGVYYFNAAILPGTADSSKVRVTWQIKGSDGSQPVANPIQGNKPNDGRVSEIGTELVPGVTYTITATATDDKGLSTSYTDTFTPTKLVGVPWHPTYEVGRRVGFDFYEDGEKTPVQGNLTVSDPDVIDIKNDYEVVKYVDHPVTFTYTSPFSGRTASFQITIVPPNGVQITASSQQMYVKVNETSTPVIATVVGSGNTGVTWKAYREDGITPAPEIIFSTQNSSGNKLPNQYNSVNITTATAGNYVLIASADADPTKTVSVKVRVSSPDGPTISVNKPSLTVVADGKTSSDSVIATVLGTANTGVTWTAYREDGITAAPEVTFQATPDLSDPNKPKNKYNTIRVTVNTPGKYVLTARADADPNQFASVKVDAIAAQTIIAAPTVTISNATTVSGTSEPNSTITVTLPDGSKVTTTTKADGSYSVTLPTPLLDGQQISVTATNASGQISQVVQVVYNITSLGNSFFGDTLTFKTFKTGYADGGAYVDKDKNLVRYYGKNSPTPVKIRTGVSKLSSRGIYFTDTDNNMYIISPNNNFPYTSVKNPALIDTNVKEFFGDNNYIKLDNSLWNWSMPCCYGQLKYFKIMDNIKKYQEWLGVSAALKNDGTLWMWGDNNYGVIGNGTREAVREPYNVMSNVKSIATDSSTAFALDISGDLWFWGGYYSSNGVSQYTTRPVKIASGVKKIPESIYRDSNSFSIVYQGDDNNLWKLTVNSDPRDPSSIVKGMLPNSSDVVQVGMGQNVYFLNKRGELFEYIHYSSRPFSEARLSKIDDNVLTIETSDNASVMYIKSDRSLWSYYDRNRQLSGENLDVDMFMGDTK